MMRDAWSRSLAMLNQATVAAVDWPAERCRHISHSIQGLPRASLPKAARVPRIRPGVDAADTAALAALRLHGLTARDLARLLGTSRGATARRLVRLRELELVRCDLDGLWEIAP
jgi:DNA-binding transcriptional ArsR family regulator